MNLTVLLFVLDDVGTGESTGENSSFSETSGNSAADTVNSKESQIANPLTPTKSDQDPGKPFLYFL